MDISKKHFIGLIKISTDSKIESNRMRPKTVTSKRKVAGLFVIDENGILETRESNRTS